MHCQLREVIITPTQHFQATPEMLFPVLGSSVQETHGHSGESSAKGSQRGIRVWSISSRAGTGQLGEGKLKRNLANSQNVGREGANMEPGSFQWVPSGRIRCNRTNLKHRRLPVDILSTSAIPWLSDSRCWLLEEIGNTVAWTSQTSSNNCVVKFAASHKFY